MARKHILGLFVLGLFLLAIFAVIAVAIRPAPQEVVAMPTLMSLPTVTETNTPTDIPTLPPNTDPPTEAPAAPTSTIEEAAPISAETSRPTEPLAPTVPTNTATATATSIPTEIPPTAEIAPTVPPVVIINSSAPEVVQPPAPAVENVVVIAFESDSSAEERAAYIESINGEVETSIEALNTVVVSVPDTVTAQALSAAPIVAQTEPDYFATVLTAPDDPLYSQQWALQAIGAESAWGELPADAQQITVAVIDTGICADHAELQGRILAGYDFVDDDAVPQDEYGHGCAVAGIIAAQANNAQGIAGLAPNAQILPLRVLNGAGYGSYSDIAEAIIYAVDQGAQVINLSLGGVNPSSLLEDAVSYAMAHGTQVVAAAGNNFGGAVMYPAAYAPVISVGSVDQNLQHSSFNPAGVLDVYAPGRDISSLAINGAYTSLTGTSLAAPHVSAAIAISMALGEPFVATGQVLSLGEGGLTPTLPPTSTPEATPEGETLPETEPIIFDRDAVERPTYPVTSDLYQLAQAYEQSAAQAQAFADTTLLQVNGEQVLVEITVSDESAIPSVVNALGSIGAQVTASGSGVIVAYIPFGQIEAAATLPGVRYIQSALPPMPVDSSLAPSAQMDASGQALTEGVAASNANVWHTAGWQGQNIKIAIIDVGFAGYTNSITSGDLPTTASGLLNIYQPSGMGFSTSDTHGTNVAEIVYDMAPQATIYLATPMDSGGSYSASYMRDYIIDFACNLGVKVIQSSMFFANAEDGDGTGLVTDAIAQAENCGALYVQAAGNSAENHWDMAATSANFDSNFNLNFAANHTVLDFRYNGSCYTLSAGSSVFVGLRWNAWPTTNQDYDLYLMRWTGTAWVQAAQSINDQSGLNLPPTEFINYVVSTPGCYGVMINLYNATGNHTFDLLGANLPAFEFNVQSRSLVDPATAIDSFAVAAVDVDSPYTREYYSSIGPAHASGGTINDGAANQQPRIAGYANVSTSFGSFKGTSSAAPHVSGAAATVWSACPSFSVTQVRQWLESHAIDLGAAGYDLQHGMGRLYLGTPPSNTPSCAPTPTPTNTPSPPPANTNLVVNGDFSAGFASWNRWNAISAITSGVMEIARQTGTPHGGFVQTINQPIPINAPMELTLQMGNSSAQPKSITLYLNTPDFSISQSCTFVVPANTPLQTYTLRTLMPAALSSFSLTGGINTADSLMALRVDNLNLQYKPALSISGTECLPPGAPANTNLVVNGDFSSGFTSWNRWNAISAITSGVMEIARQTGTPHGGFVQTINQPIPINAPMELTLQMGNSSAQPKSITLYLNTPDFSISQSCTFVVPANTALQTYTLRTLMPAALSSFSLTGGINTADSLMALRVDNLNLQYKPALSISGTECLPPGAPANTNLVVNGDFSAGFASWNRWNAISAITSGVMEIARQTGTPHGGFVQTINQPIPINAPMELTLQMGNSSAQPKSITLYLNTPDFSISQSCTFVVPANTALQTYTLRTLMPAALSSFSLTGGINTADSLMALRVDNLNLQYKPALSISGTECLPPGAPANTNLVVNGDFSAGFASWNRWYTISAINNGVMEIARQTGTPHGGFVQTINQPIPINAPMELTLQMGNSSAQPKSITLYLNTPDFSISQSCTFVVPANTPLQTYTLRTLMPVALSSFSLTGGINTADSLMALRVDNLNLQYKPALSISGTECNAAGGLSLELTETSTATGTAIATATPTSTTTSTETATLTPTATETALPTLTFTATPAPTDIPTNTPTETFTWTPVPTDIPTNTPTETALPTETFTWTPMPSATPIPDSDGDGITDDIDACPAVSGAAPSGCPPTETPLPSPEPPTLTPASETPTPAA